MIPLFFRGMIYTSIERFVEAQERSYLTALKEIKKGHKETHWMWYIFPQIKGLGYSELSQYYGITNVEEAIEYLNHPILSQRLFQISTELLKCQSNDAKEVFGYPDNLKLKSSMTLFSMVSNESVFNEVLEKFFDGEKDKTTVELITNLSDTEKK